MTLSTDQAEGHTFDVAIVGAGITGLAAAYRLRQAAPAQRIIVLEAADRPGGKILTEHIDGFVIEAGPDCFLSRKPRGVGLAHELGVADRLYGRQPANRKTYVRRHGKLHRLPAGLTGMIPTDLDALRESTLLSADAIARIAREPDLPPAPAGDDESVAAFITRRLGREAFDNLIEPLMGGIYAGQADQLSLAATFPQLRRLEIEHGSLLRGLSEAQPAGPADYPPFVSLPDGMGELVDALVERLDDVIRYQSRVTSLAQRADSAWQIAVNNDAAHAIHARAVILATPAFITGPLLADIDDELGAALTAIPYGSSALVTLAFAAAELPPLDGYGYVVPRVERDTVLACTWTSSKWQGRAPDGRALLRVYLGRYPIDVTTHSDERLVKLAQNELRQTLKITATPTLHRIQRWPRGMPQYNLGHTDRVAKIEAHAAQLKNLALAGAYFRGVGIPDCIASGEAAAASIATTPTDAAAPSSQPSPN